MPQRVRGRQPLVRLVLHQVCQEVPATAAVHVQQFEGFRVLFAAPAFLSLPPGAHVPLQDLQLAVEVDQVVVTAATTVSDGQHTQNAVLSDLARTGHWQITAAQASARSCLQQALLFGLLFCTLSDLEYQQTGTIIICPVKLGYTC